MGKDLNGLFLPLHNESDFDNGSILNDLVVFHFRIASFYVNTLDVFDRSSGSASALYKGRRRGIAV
jgi:hypothetical protein